MKTRTDSNALIGSEWKLEDPLGRDLPFDQQVLTTRRAICRVAFVAAETASRFEREGIDHDPMAWMMTPRRLFEGESALDACLHLTCFKRAIILHGLSYGLDGSPTHIDALIEEDLDCVEEEFGDTEPGCRRSYSASAEASSYASKIPDLPAGRGTKVAACRATRPHL